VSVSYKDKLEKLLLFLKSYLSDIEYCSHQNKYLDIVACGVNKYSALFKSFNIARCNVNLVVFGNDSNDFELLSNADYGFIVGNTLKGFQHLRHIYHIEPTTEKIAKAIQEAKSLFLI
jgi:hydroxymethylpyrimidine pyrophosphatase-like HAD family hydrolase